MLFLSIPICAIIEAEFSGGRLMPESESASSKSCLRWLFSWWRMLTSRLRLTIRASRGSYKQNRSFVSSIQPFFKKFFFAYHDNDRLCFDLLGPGSVS